MSQIADAIGPFYDTSGVRAVLGGLSEQDVLERRKAGIIVAMEAADGVVVYPVYQFADGRVDPAILPALRHFHGHPDWSVGLWFVTPNPDLGGMSAVDWLRAGHPVEEVTRSAGHTAAQWAA